MSAKALYNTLERNEVGSPKLNEDLVTAIEGLLMEGNTRTNCARVLGIHPGTLATWIKRGADDVLNERPSIHAKLALAVSVCEGEQERRLVHRAFQAALTPGSDGAMALKILERRNPDDWAPALPEMGSFESQYVGMSKVALKEEAKRVLTAAVNESKEMQGEVVNTDEEAPVQS